MERDISRPDPDDDRDLTVGIREQAAGGMGIRGAGEGFPNPDDDGGDLGPGGPRMRDLAEGIRDHAAIADAIRPGGVGGMPSPDDDGDLEDGPGGPRLDEIRRDPTAGH